MIPLLIEKDATGYAPPHYAAKHGDIKVQLASFSFHNLLVDQGQCTSHSQIELEFNSMVFAEEGKIENPEKKPRIKAET